jgi:hypothetical protein
MRRCLNGMASLCMCDRKTRVRGCAMAQAVSRQPPTAKARVRFRVSPCGICDVQSGAGTGFSSSTSLFPCQFHSTGAPLLGKGPKKQFFVRGHGITTTL